MIIVRFGSPSGTSAILSICWPMCGTARKSECRDVRRDRLNSPRTLSGAEGLHVPNPLMSRSAHMKRSRQTAWPFKELEAAFPPPHEPDFRRQQGRQSHPRGSNATNRLMAAAAEPVAHRRTRRRPLEADFEHGWRDRRAGARIPLSRLLRDPSISPFQAFSLLAQLQPMGTRTDRLCSRIALIAVAPT